MDCLFTVGSLIFGVIFCVIFLGLAMVSLKGALIALGSVIIFAGLGNLFLGNIGMIVGAILGFLLIVSRDPTSF